MAERPQEPARILQVAWLAAPAYVYLIAERADVSVAPGARGLLAEGLLALLWGAGIVAVVQLRPAWLALLRVIAGGVTGWGVLLVALGFGWWPILLAAWGKGVLLLSFSPAITRECADRLAAKRERRLPLAIPALLFCLLVVPVNIVVGTAGGLVIAELAGITHSRLLGVGLPAVALIAGVLAAWFALSLKRIGQRWLVVAPSGVVVRDPLILAETYRLVPDEIAAVEVAEGDWRVGRDMRAGSGERLLDLTGGCMSRPLIVTFTKLIPGPPLRPRGKEPGHQVGQIAIRPTDRVAALEALGSRGFAGRSGGD